MNPDHRLWTLDHPTYLEEVKCLWHCGTVIIYTTPLWGRTPHISLFFYKHMIPLGSAAE
jgi:hypothetical protein